MHSSFQLSTTISNILLYLEGRGNDLNTGILMTGLRGGKLYNEMLHEGVSRRHEAMDQ